MARSIFRVGVSETLTPEQRQARLDDVRARAAAGPCWQSADPREILGGDDARRCRQSEVEMVRLRDYQAERWRAAAVALARQMEQHLQWGE